MCVLCTQHTSTQHTRQHSPMLKLQVRSKRPIIDDTWTLTDIVKKAPPLGWEIPFKAALPEVEGTEYEIGIEERLAGMGTFYPRPSEVFRAFNMLPPRRVRVIIFGQDPYHQTLSDGRSRATGLAFSARKEDVIPESLVQIFTELRWSIPSFMIPDHGDLTEWVTQGVLLLNYCLTVKPNCPNSHAGLWMGFITHILHHITEVNPKVIVCLWGKEAQDAIEPILMGSKAVVLQAAHPVARGAQQFVGCGHFAEINRILISRGEPPINWSLTPLYIEKAHLPTVSIPVVLPTNTTTNTVTEST